MPLSPMALTTLRAWKLACPPDGTKNRIPDGGWRRPRNRKHSCKPIQPTPSCVKMLLGLVAVVEGREEPESISFLHDLRHTAASRFIEDMSILKGHGWC